MSNEKYDIGMIGLGVMGRNLVYNFADHGFSVAGYDKDDEKVSTLNKEGENKKVEGTKSVEDFISMLKKPRSVMMLVPAGKPVDSVIRKITPLLDEGDLIIDGGNSHYVDTDKRFKRLQKKGIKYIGVGISGGEKGARLGPSMMPGGESDVYEKVKPIFEAAAAHVKGEPCVTFLGKGSAGHYVKMVHNGIEYGLMQLISESYDFMKRGLGLTNEELHKVYNDWNKAELQSFLVEITSKIFTKKDDKTDKYLVDMILDSAKQKGTGKWTSQDAMELQVPTPTIDTAVEMRDLSAYKNEREEAGKILTGPLPMFDGNREELISDVRNALYFSMITTYAQGMVLLRAASKEYDYGVSLKDVAKIWRGGCIIRAALLEEIYSAFDKVPDLPNLMVDPYLTGELGKRNNSVRTVIKYAVDWGIPVPGFASALSYYDGYRLGRMPANLLQAQRDFFGSHTYERVDEEGTFHTKWEK